MHIILLSMFLYFFYVILRTVVKGCCLSLINVLSLLRTDVTIQNIIYFLFCIYIFVHMKFCIILTPVFQNQFY